VRSESGGTDPARSGKLFFGRAPPLFWLQKYNFGERFCDGQYSLVSFLFVVLLLTVSPCSMESAPLPTCHVSAPVRVMSISIVDFRYPYVTVICRINLLHCHSLGVACKVPYCNDVAKFSKYSCLS